MKNIIIATTAIMLIGCGNSTGGGSSDDASTDMFTNIEMSAKQALGKDLYFDKNLSKTRNTSCATCHDIEHAFIDARFREDGKDQTVFIHGALSVGDDKISLGGRNAPTVTYAKFSPTFDAENVLGGQFHDGRAATLKDQAMGPPLDTAEMQMPDRASVVERIKENSAYVSAFKTVFGADVFSNEDTAYEAMGEAIGDFEKLDVISPFDSKYDRFLRGEYTMTKAESAGKALFFSNNNTNCTDCHQLNTFIETKGETFTNYKYENIGTPKNFTALSAKANLGLGDITDIEHGALNQGSADGAIKVPTLRNVAVTGPYMHNGVFAELKTVLEFYEHIRGAGKKPLNPETNKPWGEVDVEATINTTLLTKGKELTDKKIANLEAFLETLTDKRYEHLLN